MHSNSGKLNEALAFKEKLTEGDDIDISALSPMETCTGGYGAGQRQ